MLLVYAIELNYPFYNYRNVDIFKENLLISFYPEIVKFKKIYFFELLELSIKKKPISV